MVGVDHEPTLLRDHGRTAYLCSCGWCGPWQARTGAAVVDFVHHLNHNREAVAA